MNKYGCAFGGLVSLALVGSAQAGVVYALDLRSTPNRLLSFPSNAPALNVVGNIVPDRDSFAMDFNGAGTILYAVTPGAAPFEVGTINTATGAYTAGPAVTGLGTGDSPTGLKFDPQTNGYILSTNGASGNNLWNFNPVTGAASLLSTVSGLAAGAIVIDIAIDISGNMYGHEIGGDNLVSINKNTGVATVIGPTGFAANFAQGMDFDYATGELFATIYTGGGTGAYCKFNLATGAATSLLSTTTWNAEMEMAINSPVPAPGSLALLGLAGIMARKRRR